MSISRFVLCLVGLALVTPSYAQQPKTGPSGLLPPAVHNQIRAKVNDQPMTFFVVNGAPDSCGRGCSRWIVAEGMFVLGTGARFKDFLATASRRKLPVFLHSPGGNLAAGLEMAALLRDYRMTAGVGRTTPEGCTAFGGVARSCRAVMDAGTELRGKLQEVGGVCMSVCVYAFAAASARRVYSGAVLAVHAAHLDQRVVQKLSKPARAKIKQYTMADVHKGLKYLLLTWGVDPELEAIAEKVSPSRLYALSRAEIDRLGLETRDLFETPWYTFDAESGPPFVAKALTQLNGPGPREFGTTQFSITCAKTGGGLMFDYQRESPPGTSWSMTPSMTQISAGDVKLSLFSSALGDVGVAPLDHAMLQAIGETKVIRFELALPNAPPSRAIDISTAGLAAHLVALHKRCPQTG